MPSKKKQETVQSQTQQGTSNTANTYGWETPGDTADTKALRDWRPQIDGGIGAQYGNARNQLSSSFSNPLGGYATPQARDAQMRTGMRQLNQDEASAYRGAYGDANQQREGQLGALANMTAPRLVQTGGTNNYSGSGSGNSTTTMTTPALDNILNGASSAAML